PDGCGDLKRLLESPTAHAHCAFSARMAEMSEAHQAATSPRGPAFLPAAGFAGRRIMAHDCAEIRVKWRVGRKKMRRRMNPWSQQRAAPFFSTLAPQPSSHFPFGHVLTRGPHHGSHSFAAAVTG